MSAAAAERPALIDSLKADLAAFEQPFDDAPVDAEVVDS